MSVGVTQMRGTNSQYAELNDKHTIFLFDKNSPYQVLPAFAQYLLSCFTDEEICVGRSIGIFSVGQVGKDADDKNIPHSITHYLPTFKSTAKTKSPRPQNLLNHFRVGRNEYMATLDSAQQINWICMGLCRLINLLSNNGEKRIHESRYSLNALCRDLAFEQQKILRTQLLSWCDADLSSPTAWATRLDEVRCIISMFGITRIDCDFTSWSPTGDNLPGKDATATENIFSYKDPESSRSVEIELSTIHSVKGETHFATLLLETFYRKHNIASVLEFLSGLNKKSATGKEKLYRMKCNYVALTRAQALICIAIPRDFVDSVCEKALEEIGWNVVTIA